MGRLDFSEPLESYAKQRRHVGIAGSSWGFSGDHWARGTFSASRMFLEIFQATIGPVKIILEPLECFAEQFTCVKVAWVPLAVVLASVGPVSEASYLPSQPDVWGWRGARGKS